MSSSEPDIDVVVAGHLCLDIIPQFLGPSELRPGSLSEVGPATFTPGGCVSNVGLALHTLGVRVALLAAIGQDAFGEAIKDVLHARDPKLAEYLQETPHSATSYTLVISPPGQDRLFLHHAGCNDSYGAGDIDLDVVQRAKVLHVGYPPLMRQLCANEGEALETLLAKAKEAGVTTSLDMAMPDPNAPAGKLDWRAILKRCLPQVELFLPSLAETYYMLRGERYPVRESEQPKVGLLRELADELLAMGAAMVGLKLGEHGLYLKTAEAQRLEQMGRATPKGLTWSERELWAPIFETDTQGTTGAGDSTIAGFLAALLRLERPEQVLRVANAVGAFSVEQTDAVSGVRSWDATRSRLEHPWEQAELELTSWHLDPETGVFIAP